VIPPHPIRSYLPFVTATSRIDDSERYEIRVEGHLDPRWAARFDGMSLTNESDSTSIIHGPVVDQAALHGPPRRLRDVGLPLVSVTQRKPDQPGLPAVWTPDRNLPEEH
jgi:hypothetical protein